MPNTTDQNDTETLAHWRALAAKVAEQTKTEGGDFDDVFAAVLERLQEETEAFFVLLADKATTAALGHDQ